MTDPAHTVAPRPAAGDGMLHPVALGALLLLVVNDHVLKARFGGWVTGKLSDVAGMVFFPLLLVALAEVAQRATGRFTQPSLRVLTVAVLLTGVVFALTKTWEPAGDAYRLGLGVLQWPFHALRALLAGSEPPPLRTVRHVVDPTDLVALPGLALAYVVGRRRT